MSEKKPTKPANPPSSSDSGGSSRTATNAEFANRGKNVIDIVTETRVQRLDPGPTRPPKRDGAPKK